LDVGDDVDRRSSGRKDISQIGLLREGIPAKISLKTRPAFGAQSAVIGEKDLRIQKTTRLACAWPLHVSNIAIRAHPAP